MKFLSLYLSTAVLTLLPTMSLAAQSCCNTAQPQRDSVRLECDVPYFRSCPDCETFNLPATKSRLIVKHPHYDWHSPLYHPKWIRIKQDKAGNVTFKVRKNRHAGTRLDSLIARCKCGKRVVYLIHQLGQEPDVLLSKQQVTICGDEPTFTLDMLANKRFHLNMPDWLSYSPSADGCRLVFTAQPLSEGETRTGNIIFSDDRGPSIATVKVIQHASPSYWYRKPCFAVVSDIHIGAPDGEGWQVKIPRMLRHIKAYEPQVRHIFVVGDLSTACLKQEYIEMMKLFRDTALVSPGVGVTLIRGNHDNKRPDGQQLFAQIVGQPEHQYQIIDGYPFISISSTSRALRGTMCYDQEARDFLSRSLKDASERFPGKPIFVFNHVPPANTIMGSHNGRGVAELTQILSQYPQVIDFSGHSHISVCDAQSINQQQFTAINDGAHRSTHFASLRVSDHAIHGKIAETVTEGLIVHFDASDNVVIERWNTALNKKCGADWVVKSPFNSSQFTYQKVDGGQTPHFHSGDSLALTYLTCDSINLYVPQATDDEFTLAYQVSVCDKSGHKVRHDIMQASLFNRGPHFAKALTLGIGQLPAGQRLTVTVWALDAAKQKSAPLRLTFDTPRHKAKLRKK